jgi:hypothetical protein
VEGRVAVPLLRGIGAFEYPSGCAAYRYENPEVDISSYEAVSDGVALEAAVQQHRKLQQELADGVMKLGLTPMSPAERTCWFDLAWFSSDGTTLHVVEVKSIADAMSLRLGIGQVLDYSAALEHHRKVVAHLLIGAPASVPEHWDRVGERAKVNIAWETQAVLDRAAEIDNLNI